MLGLYPGREEYRFLKGQQLGFCSSLPRPQEFMLCRQLGPVSAARIRQEFERALRSGITSNGDLLNLYLSVLKEDGASAEQIEQVRRMLLRHHPALLPPGGECPGKIWRSGSRVLGWDARHVVVIRAWLRGHSR